MTITPGLKKLTDAGEHLAELAAGLAHELHRRGRAVAHVADDVAASSPRRRPARAAARPSRRRPRPPRGSRGCRSGRPSSLPGTWMWPMSPAAPWAPRWIRPSAMMPAADAGADLDEQQVVDVAPAPSVLAQRHDVHVVVDQHGRAEAVGAAARATR